MCLLLLSPTASLLPKYTAPLPPHTYVVFQHLEVAQAALLRAQSSVGSLCVSAGWVAFKLLSSLHKRVFLHALFALLALFFMLAYNFDSKSGSDMFLLNVGLLPQDYTAPHRRKQNSSSQL
jgi:hypothetical protein